MDNHGYSRHFQTTNFRGRNIWTFLDPMAWEDREDLSLCHATGLSQQVLMESSETKSWKPWRFIKQKSSYHLQWCTMIIMICTLQWYVPFRSLQLHDLALCWIIFKDWQWCIVISNGSRLGWQAWSPASESWTHGFLWQWINNWVSHDPVSHDHFLITNCSFGLLDAFGVYPISDEKDKQTNNHQELACWTYIMAAIWVTIFTGLSCTIWLTTLLSCSSSSLSDFEANKLRHWSRIPHRHLELRT